MSIINGEINFGVELEKMKMQSKLLKAVFIITILTIFLPGVFSQVNEDCLMCHEDPEMTMERNGKNVSIYTNPGVLQKSVHKRIECTSCHKDAADPDFKHAEQLVKLKGVNCGSCHEEYAKHVENDIHSKLGVGNKAPDCKKCHKTHSVVNPDKISNKSKYYCGQCHQQNVLSNQYHIIGEVNNSCMECHDQSDYTSDLSKSVHGKLSCSNCHGYVAANIDTHMENPELVKTADCYLCHGPIAAEHRESIHGISIAEGINEAAQCWNCHGSHSIYRTETDSSPVYPKNLVNTCGKCHDDPDFGRKFFSTVKQPGKMYSTSVHGKLVEKGSMDAASCVTCHGVHNIKNRVQQGSKISSINVPNTCSECHGEIVDKYKTSIHWIAVKKGVRESPTCNDCHSEHAIHAVNTVNKREEIKKIQENTCLQCHQNLLLSQRYGINEENAKDYQDSYHGLAVMRGDKDAAMCIDCHGVHSILPKYHKESTIHENNVLETCKKCHANANQMFAISYAHYSDEDTESGFIQNLISTIYFWMIVIVIGGMLVHNIIIYIYDLRKKLDKRRKKIRVPRLTKNEVIQHIILLVSFIILAITGFQLKYPDSWWAEGLNFFYDETVRQNIHRASASIMILLSVYHVIYMIFTARGRELLKGLVPRYSDIQQAIQSMLYFVGIKKKHPEFDNFSYIEKAEYWALIWGTLIMGATGFILWFPTVVGDWAPIWLIKVSEIIHFYEAVLATLAIVVWHWFFVIYRPALRFTFLDGKMSLEYFKEEHKLMFKKVLKEWDELKKGEKTEKQLSQSTKLFFSTVEKQGVNVDEFIQQELDKDQDLKEFLEQK